MEKTWKQVASNDTGSITYEVSNDGYIRKLRNGVPTKVSKGSNSIYGYKRINVFGESQYIHRLVAFAFCNPPANWDALQVDHVDGNTSNNNASNLRWVSHKQNQQNKRPTGQKRQQLPLIATCLVSGKEYKFANQTAAANALYISQGSLSQLLAKQGSAPLSRRRRCGYKSLGGFSFRHDLDPLTYAGFYAAPSQAAVELDPFATNYRVGV